MEGSSLGSFGKDAVRTITIGFRLGTGVKSWASSHKIFELVFFFFFILQWVKKDKVKKYDLNRKSGRELVLCMPGWEKSPGVGNANPLQYSCLKDSIHRGAWQAIVLGTRRVTKSQT